MSDTTKSYKQTLHYLIDNNDIEGVTKYLKNNKNYVLTQDTYGRNEITHAADDLNFEMVELLIKNNFNPNEISENGSFPLQSAITSCQIDDDNNRIRIVKLLIENQADVDMEKNDESTLIMAINKSETEIAKILAPILSDINKEFENGMTAMLSACINSSAVLVETMFDSGAKIEISKKHIKNELHESICNQNTDVALLLIQKGADVNYVCKLTGNSPLIECAKSNNIIVAASLIKNKCDMLHKNKLNVSAYDMAISNNSYDIKQIIDNSSKNFLTVIDAKNNTKTNKKYKPPKLNVITQNQRE